MMNVINDWGVQNKVFVAATKATSPIEQARLKGKTVYTVNMFTKREDDEIDTDLVFGVFSSMEKAYDAVQSMRRIAEKRGDGKTPDKHGWIRRFECYDETKKVMPDTGCIIVWIEWELNSVTSKGYDTTYMYKISEAILDQYVADERSEL